MQAKFSIKTIVYIGVLTALEIVLSRFLSINAWNIKIGFSFVPIAAAAILLGWLPAAIVGALGDFIGALLFPIGAYFPGFTFTAFLTGIVFGLLLKGEKTWPKIVLAAGINQLVLGLFLNTGWISILYGSPYWALFVTRLLQCGILFVMEIVVIKLISIPLERYKNLLID